MVDRTQNKRIVAVATILMGLGLVAGFLTVNDPFKLLALLVMGTVVGLCLFSRWWGALMLVGIAPFYGFARYVLEIPTTLMLVKEIVVVLISASWLLDDIFLKRVKLPQNPILMPLGIFLFIIVVQFLRTGSPLQSLFGLRIYVTYLPLFYVMLTEKITNRRLKIALLVMVISTMLTVAYGFWQWILGLEGLENLGLAKAGPNIAAAGHLRVFSTYGGPEYFAANLIMQMLMLFSLFTSSQNPAGKVIYAVCIGLMMFMLANTLYRSMWVMALISIIALLVMLRKYRYIFLMILVIVLVVRFSPPYVSERAGLTFSKDDESYQIRKELYFRTNVINILENILGYGVGSSMGNIAFTEQTGRRHSSRLLMGGSTESWLASVTVELGLAGVLVYLWLVLSVIKTSLHVYKMAPDPLWRGLGLGFSAFTIGDLVVSSFFLVPACFPAGDLYFWFLSALLANKYHQLEYSGQINDEQNDDSQEVSG
jgi:hypothetical protein